jgi:hypothetical protein
VHTLNLTINDDSTVGDELISLHSAIIIVALCYRGDK